MKRYVVFFIVGCGFEERMAEFPTEKEATDYINRLVQTNQYERRELRIRSEKGGRDEA